MIKEGLPLLQNDPKLVVNTFYLKLPAGVAQLNGSLSLKGFQQSDLKNTLLFLQRFTAQFNLELPQQTLENLVVTQARNLFTVDASAEEQPNVEEIDALARSLLSAQLDEWAAQKLIRREGSQIATSVLFSGGNLKINNTAVPLPWQEQEEPAPADASAAK